jgi:hypothetical protein
MYLRIDEESEVANALRMAARLAAEVEADPALWRWIIIALHNAAQGMMVLSLRHGNDILTLSDECFKATMEAHDSNLPPPLQKLDTYLNLYAKVKSPNTGQVGGNKRFSPEGTQGTSIKRLNNLRNEFSHFTPKGWSLELNGLPGICRDVTALISFLGWQTQNVLWKDEQAREYSQTSADAFVVTMNPLERHYA